MYMVEYPPNEKEYTARPKTQMERLILITEDTGRKEYPPIRYQSH